MLLEMKTLLSATIFAFYLHYGIGQGLLPQCSNPSYSLSVDMLGTCGVYRCSCSDLSTCSTDLFYCPCPFLFADVSKEKLGSSCRCTLANLCGTTCPASYVNFGGTCVRRTSTGRFTIDLVNMNAPDEYDEYFRTAANRWEGIITSDISDVSASLFQGSWFGDEYPYYEDVDDVVIGYSVTSVDGPGGTLARSGPFYVRDGKDDSNKGLPVSGMMQFDESDVERLVEDGSIVSVIIHEMAHVLGFGTRWPTRSMCGSTCGVYNEGSTGVCFASAEYKNLDLDGELMVETQGIFNDGTFCSHWSHDQLGPEIMTGSISSEQSYYPLTSITIGAMADLGYAVDYSQAEPLENPSRFLPHKNFRPKKVWNLMNDVIRISPRGISEIRRNSTSLAG